MLKITNKVLIRPRAFTLVMLTRANSLKVGFTLMNMIIMKDSFPVELEKAMES